MRGDCFFCHTLCNTKSFVGVRSCDVGSIAWIEFSAARPCAPPPCAANARRARGRPFPGAPPAGAFLRRLFGALRRLPARGSLVHAVVGDDVESPGAVLFDAGRDLSLVVRLQRLDRLATERPRRPAASGSPRWRSTWPCSLPWDRSWPSFPSARRVGRSWCCSTWRSTRSPDCWAWPFCCKRCNA